MKILRGNLTQMEPMVEPVALTIGNFDGVHRGHQHLIEELLQVAEQKNLRPAIMSFEPHPDLVFQSPDFHLLMTPAKKAAHLEELGVEFLVLQDFDSAFATVSAEDFLRQYLGSFFNLQHLLLGFDFRFGHKGEGDFSMACEYFRSRSIHPEQGSPFLLDGERVSSTLIRSRLSQGDVGQAARALGRPYSLSGTVAEGLKLGRQIGFPTANLAEIETQIPGFGVYHCRIECQGQQHQSVVNIGQRPTVQGKDPTVEAHILDFSGDLYGQKLELHFVQKIRDEKKFENLDRLKEQIQKDVDSIKG